jgi:hypothetical protein
MTADVLAFMVSELHGMSPRPSPMAMANGVVVDFDGNHVSNFDAGVLQLSQGRLVDAADVLRDGAAGTAAAALVEGWCREAAARAATEQALCLLRAHATVLAAAGMKA